MEVKYEPKQSKDFLRHKLTVVPIYSYCMDHGKLELRNLPLSGPFERACYLFSGSKEQSQEGE